MAQVSLRLLPMPLVHREEQVSLLLRLMRLVRHTEQVNLLVLRLTPIPVTRRLPAT
jgi:hypothetical protein